MNDATRPRHTARRSRIAAMGVGVAAMAGLVGNMEVAGSHASVAAVKPTTTPLPPQPDAKAEMAYRHKVALERLTAVNLPIVLTPHAVVHTVAAPAAPSYAASSGGYAGGSAYAAAAPVRAAAPVASTGGSHP